MTATLIGSHPEYDAVVVGARPAGAATAMLLGRAGKRVLLVDRSGYGSDTMSTHALLRSGVMQLNRWGLLDQIRASGTPAIRGTAFHYGDDAFEAQVSDKHGIDALYAPRRTVLDPAIVEGACAAGVEVRYGVRITALRRDATGRVTGVVGGDGAIADAGVVVGADGAGSLVARAVGAENSYDRTETSAFAYCYFGGLRDDIYDWYFRPGVSAGVIPTNGGVAAVFAGIAPAAYTASLRERGLDATFQSVLHTAAPELAARLAGAQPVGRIRSFPGRPAHLRRASGPGWALVGDAGYFKDPITAHGITDALIHAELLAQSLLTTGAGTHYEAERDRLVRPLLDVTTELASLTWDLTTIVGLQRDLKHAIDAEVAYVAALDHRSQEAAA
jgi:flavin-dependent dehydrogenase